MLSGRQIREARAILGLQRNELAARTKVLTTTTIIRAESVDGEPPITAYQANAIQQALEHAGLEFTVEPPGVRWRSTRAHRRITAAQIREARRLLRCSSPTLSKRAGVGFDLVLRAQLDDGELIDSGALQAIERSLTRSGVRFTPDGGVNLRRARRTE